MDILRISRHPELLPQAAAWFHGKWGIPLSAYEESMEEALKAAAPELVERFTRTTTNRRFCVA